MAALPKHSDRKRTVVITQGCDPVVVVVGTGITEYPITPLPQEKIVDTNGAGDAFVGGLPFKNQVFVNFLGFLAQYIQGKDMSTAIECANYAAAAIIQKNGCTAPDYCKYH